MVKLYTYTVISKSNEPTAYIWSMWPRNILITSGPEWKKFLMIWKLFHNERFSFLEYILSLGLIHIFCLTKCSFFLKHYILCNLITYIKSILAPYYQQKYVRNGFILDKKIMGNFTITVSWKMESVLVEILRYDSAGIF